MPKCHGFVISQCLWVRNSGGAGLGWLQFRVSHVVAVTWGPGWVIGRLLHSHVWHLRREDLHSGAGAAGAPGPLSYLCVPSPCGLSSMGLLSSPTPYTFDVPKACVLKMAEQSHPLFPPSPGSHTGSLLPHSICQAAQKACPGSREGHIDLADLPRERASENLQTCFKTTNKSCHSPCQKPSTADHHI